MTNIIFVKNGKEYSINAKNGLTILDVSQDVDVKNFLDGNCGGALSCGSCHVFVEDNFLDLIPSATEEEDDLLEISPITQKNSRLACQIFVSDELDGIRIYIP